MNKEIEAALMLAVTPVIQDIKRDKECAHAVIGGLLVSTMLTLVVIPVVYNLLDRRSDAAYRERGERKHGSVMHDEGLPPLGSEAHGVAP